MARIFDFLFNREIGNRVRPEDAIGVLIRRIDNQIHVLENEKRVLDDEIHALEDRRDELILEHERIVQIRRDEARRRELELEWIAEQERLEELSSDDS